MNLKTFLLGTCSAIVIAGFAQAETLTIATVNNGDMVRMQTLTDDFTKANPDIQLEWVTLEENVLRERVTTDIATKGGQYDVLTIGTYEVPIWAKQGWLLPLDNLGADYDVDDLLPAIRSGLTADGKLYAAPFYGESSMVMYRKDLMETAGLKMPEAPTWEFIGEAARAMTDRENDINGICLRGKAGWGENMAFLTAMSNSFGARWFDENWTPQFDQPEWKATLDTYLSLMADAGPAGASSNGFNENLTLFQQGKCGMWIDATVAASFVTNPKDSTVADKVGFALAPDNGLGKRSNWLWAWALAIPAGTATERRSCREVRILGNQQALSRHRCGQGRLGKRSSGHAHLALQQPGVPEGRSVRQDDARQHQCRRPQEPLREACALRRRSVRRDPGVSGSRHDGRTALLRRSGRSDDG